MLLVLRDENTEGTIIKCSLACERVLLVCFVSSFLVLLFIFHLTQHIIIIINFLRILNSFTCAIVCITNFSLYYWCGHDVGIYSRCDKIQKTNNNLLAFTTIRAAAAAAFIPEDSAGRPGSEAAPPSPPLQGTSSSSLTDPSLSTGSGVDRCRSYLYQRLLYYK